MPKLVTTAALPKDRRRRFSVHWDLRAGHWEAGTISGQITNISLSGLKFRVPARYKVGNMIEIEMSPSVQVCIRAIVKISREHAYMSGMFEYGAVFVNLADDHANMFRESVLQVRREEY